MVRAIKSALAQTHEGAKVRVYDNASGDETEATVAQLAAEDSRVSYHRHDRNLGSFANYRYAMEHVDTPYYSVLADDDLLLPDFHRLALETFKSQPKLILVGLGCLHSEIGGALLRRPTIGPGTYSPPEGMVEMLRQGHLTWTSVLFRREVLELIGGLDRAADLYLDVDVLLRATARAPFTVRPEPGAVYFYHDDASSSSASTDLGRWNAFAHIVDRTAADPDLPAGIRAEAAERLRAMFRGMLIKAGVGAARRGDYIGAATAAQELRERFGDRSAAAVVTLAANAARIPGGRSVLSFAARARRPYTGEQLPD